MNGKKFKDKQVSIDRPLAATCQTTEINNDFDRLLKQLPSSGKPKEEP